MNVYLIEVVKPLTLAANGADAAAGDRMICHQQSADGYLWNVYQFSGKDDPGTVFEMTIDELAEHVRRVKVNGKAVRMDFELHRDGTVYMYPDAGRDIFEALQKKSGQVTLLDLELSRLKSAIAAQMRAVKRARQRNRADEEAILARLKRQAAEIEKQLSHEQL